MKLRLASLALVAAVLVAAPAMASTLYSNGPINGNIDAWNTCCGLAVADSFTLSSSSTVTGFDAGFWVVTGDSPVSTSWAITTGNPSFLGGSVVASGSGSYSNSLYCTVCGFGAYDIYTSTLAGLNVSLGAGTYFLELYNGQTTFGGNSSLFWDENDGPSLAYQNTIGLGGIGSHAFNVYGTGGTTTPEPGTLMLFGSGAAGLAGMLRRKINP